MSVCSVAGTRPARSSRTRWSRCRSALGSTRYAPAGAWPRWCRLRRAGRWYRRPSLAEPGLADQLGVLELTGELGRLGEVDARAELVGRRLVGLFVARLSQRPAQGV